MLLGNLDNEVIFKKAFTDPFVFKGFVKDILGIDMEVGTIETEKKFEPKLAYVDFKLDIFAESKDHRIIVEIQRIEYDHNFDRFLHYFLMSIAELQRSSKQYGIKKTVYTIVVLTAPYKVEDKMGNVVLNEVLISKLNPKNLKGEEIDIFGHQLVFLNSYHRDDFTTNAYRDWLDLIYQSINNPEDPQVNLLNPAIRRVTEIIDVDNLTPEERNLRKIAESTRATQKIYEDYGIRKGMQIGLEQGLQQGLEQGQTLEKIAIIKTLVTQGILTDEQIAMATNTKLELVAQVRNDNRVDETFL